MGWWRLVVRYRGGAAGAGAASADLRGRDRNRSAAGGVRGCGRAAHRGVQAVICGRYRQQNGVSEYVRTRSAVVGWIFGGDACRGGGGHEIGRRTESGDYRGSCGVRGGGGFVGTSGLGKDCGDRVW